MNLANSSIRAVVIWLMSNTYELDTMNSLTQKLCSCDASSQFLYPNSYRLITSNRACTHTSMSTHRTINYICCQAQHHFSLTTSQGIPLTYLGSKVGHSLYVGFGAADPPRLTQLSSPQTLRLTYPHITVGPFARRMPQRDEPSSAKAT